jgi:hypothetical protein
MLEDVLESLLRFYRRGLEQFSSSSKKLVLRVEVYRLMINDGAVRGLLLIHGLHPVPLETPA